MPWIAFSRFSSGSVVDRIWIRPSDTEVLLDVLMRVKIMTEDARGSRRW
jgi:hypothetical protein